MFRSMAVVFLLGIGLCAASLLAQPGFADGSVASISAKQTCQPVSRSSSAGGGPVQLAQEEECPPDFPVDCFNGRCCPTATACCDDGSCCPTGYPHHCGSRCYATLQGALDAGCNMADISVCGVAQ